MTCVAPCILAAYHRAMKWQRTLMVCRCLSAAVFLGFAGYWTVTGGPSPWIVAFVGLVGAYSLAIAIAITVRRHAQRT